MQVKNFLYPLLAICFVAACDKSEQWGSAQQTKSVEVSISASHSAMSRTALGDVPSDVTSGSEQPIEWSVGDKISVWAKADGDENYTLEGVTFTLSTYNSTFDDADFMATIDPMVEGTYAYHAVYPEPTAKSGTKVSYTLPSNQSGAYDPALDVMVAQATGNALLDRVDDEPTNLTWQEPQLEFNHLFHMIRIRIPEGKNLLGQPIKRLDIVFPRDVVGTAEFDVTNPSNITWSNMSNKITVEIPDESNYLDENSNYVWLYIIPGALNGEITFQAYDSYGVPSLPISTTLNKEANANRVTPVALMIPISSLGDITYIDIKEVANNLGEDWNTMTFSGRTFVVPFTGTTSNELIINENDEKFYKFAICADPATLVNQSLEMVYDSPNTYFADPVKLGSSHTNGKYMVEKTVPYLLEEDFSRIKTEEESFGNNGYNTGNEHEFGGVALTQLPDWNASRFWAKDGTMRLNTRYQEVKIIISFKTELFGRLDTPSLSKLKDAAKVKLSVSFDAGAYPHVNSGYEIYSTYISVATHEDSSKTINGMAEGTKNGISSYENTRANMVKTHETIEVKSGYPEDYFGQQYTSYPTNNGVIYVADVTQSTRLCFYPSSNHATGGLTNCESNVYIDNIKVSIAN